MTTKYKLFLTMSLFSVIGCRHEHQCIVQKVSGKTISVKDIESGKNKKLVMHISDSYHLNYVYPGDTIFFCPVETLVAETNYEQDSIIDVPVTGYVKYNPDSLYVRQGLKNR